MANNMTARITGILGSGNNYSTGVVKLIPDMIDHIGQHGDVSSTLTRLLNGTVSKRDSERVKDIVGAVVSAGLTIKFDKASAKWTCVLRSAKAGGMVVNGNAMGVLRSLGEANTKLHSAEIDANLFEPKEQKETPWLFDSKLEALLKKASKEGVTADDVRAAVVKQVAAFFPEAFSGYTGAKATDAAAGADVSEAEVIEAVPALAEPADVADAA